MKISTSINISLSRKKKLISAAKELGVAVSDILAALMSRSRLYHNSVQAELFNSVDYQPDSCFEGEEYIIMHVRLNPVCYEYGVSERLLFKVSVSLIFRVAIDLFLDNIIKYGLNTPVNDKDDGTNYLELKYNIEYKHDFLNEFWVIIWDIRNNRHRKGKKNEKTNNSSDHTDCCPGICR